MHGEAVYHSMVVGVDFLAKIEARVRLGGEHQ
jgi:hypothetical protein